MSKALVIVESPAKAKTISKYLGPRYVIKASMGHVRDLPVSEFGVDPNNAFKPKYVVLSGRKKLVQELKKLSQSMDSVYVAPDPDREGEAIAWHLSELLKHKSTYRVSFNEITQDAVRSAFNHPGKIDIRKVDSQQTRRILDRIVGYKISPFLWKSVGKGLSAGRVQSVAVMLVCERDKEIDAFVQEEYWSIVAHLSKKNETALFDAKLEKIDDKAVSLVNEDQAKEIITRVENKQFQVTKIDKKQKQQWAPPPFITSQLQQSASTRLNFSVQKTMQIAQQLYEGIDMGKEGNVALITYMRTDSFRVAREAQTACRVYIEKKFGKKFVPEKVRIFKAKKGAQEAHEAIRPSYMNREPETVKEFLSSDQFRLYKLIWDRFLASQMKAATIKLTTIDIIAQNCLFLAKGREIIFPGFLTVAGENGGGKGENGEDFLTIIPSLTGNELLDCHEVEGKQHFTKPPPRYTEASLVRAMEEKEIGRPSTYAPTIQTILRRGYVSKEKNKLFSTELGKNVTDILVKHFKEIINIEFTASMEKELDLIEEGEVQWQQVLQKFYEPFMVDLMKASKEVKSIRKEVKQTSEICEACGAAMVIRSGKFGEFIACSTYPQCKNSKPKEVGINCPSDDCGGVLVKRVSRKGKRFLGCSNYPQCRYTQNMRP
ncbi:type I DNA topoisomerase [Chlamydiota bacterium]